MNRTTREQAVYHNKDSVTRDSGAAAGPRPAIATTGGNGVADQDPESGARRPGCQRRSRSYVI